MQNKRSGYTITSKAISHIRWHCSSAFESIECILHLVVPTCHWNGNLNAFYSNEYERRCKSNQNKWKNHKKDLHQMHGSDRTTDLTVIVYSINVTGWIKVFLFMLVCASVLSANEIEWNIRRICTMNCEPNKTNATPSMQLNVHFILVFNIKPLEIDGDAL